MKMSRIVVAVVLALSVGACGNITGPEVEAGQAGSAQNGTAFTSGGGTAGPGSSSVSGGTTFVTSGG